MQLIQATTIAATADVAKILVLDLQLTILVTIVYIISELPRQLAAVMIEGVLSFHKRLLSAARIMFQEIKWLPPWGATLVLRYHWANMPNEREKCRLSSASDQR